MCCRSTQPSFKNIPCTILFALCILNPMFSLALLPFLTHYLSPHFCWLGLLSTARLKMTITCWSKRTIVSLFGNFDSDKFINQ
ncbi:hypothetical protein K438DRAFT_557197 [Mycena galopus ATCC 62051]|nr:hypothetical protein K438DRAFT_557197 [Mycena galopus ATCC 62051]